LNPVFPTVKTRVLTIGNELLNRSVSPSVPVQSGPEVYPKAPI